MNDNQRIMAKLDKRIANLQAFQKELSDDDIIGNREAIASIHLLKEVKKDIEVVWGMTYDEARDFDRSYNESHSEKGVCLICGSTDDLMSFGHGKFICETCAMIQNEKGIENE